MNASAHVVVAVDVGGTFVKSALVRSDGAVCHAQRHATRSGDGGDAVVAGLLSAVTDLVGTARSANLRPVAAGVAVPGIVDERAGVARAAANLGWSNVPIQQIVAAHLRLPTVLSHDVRAGAVAEARIGAGRGSPSMLFVPIGTGVAAAHVVDGVARPGAHHAAGEIGHLIVRTRGPRCACGGRGCLEAISSAAAVGRRYRTRTGREAGAADVVRRAGNGDREAALVWREAIAALAIALAATVTVLDPHQVVIGGGLAEAGDALMTPLAAGLRARLTVHQAPPLARALLGDLAGCIGAALLAADTLARPGPPSGAA
jgi:glucokinase